MRNLSCLYEAAESERNSQRSPGPLAGFRSGAAEEQGRWGKEGRGKEGMEKKGEGKGNHTDCRIAIPCL